MADIIKFTHDGVDYDIDRDILTLKEAAVLKRFLGVLPPEWSQMLRDEDPEALQFWYWLGFSRAGVDIKPGDVDVQYSMAANDVRMADGALGQDDDEDPTTSPEEGTTP